MNKVIVRPLRPHEKKKLRGMKRQRNNAVNSRHALIVMLSRGGLSNRAIAECVDCSPQWVRTIIHRFNADGVAGIFWCASWQVRDTPRKFMADIREQIAEVALSSPKSLIGMNQWSLPKLRAYLVQQNILPSISIEWLRQFLHRCKIRLRRTKTWKESTDPFFWLKYRAIRRLYRKCPSTTYTRKGGVRHFLAVYDLETNRLFGQFTQRKRWVEFLAFLKWIRRRYPSQQVLHVVLDNYSPHLKAEVREWAAIHNIRFNFTPTEGSWLNRIECHFTALKKFALDTSDFRSHNEQQKAIEDYLSWRNRKREISMQAWNSRNRAKSYAA